MTINYLATAVLWFGGILYLVSQVVAQQVTGFTLMNAASDNVIGPIKSGDKIVLSIVGNQLSIRADTSGSIGSVRFDFDGVTKYQTESVSPYALGGDSNGNYAPVGKLAVEGSHNVSATPFSGSNLGGTPGTTLTITFDVTAVATPPPSSSDVPPYNHGPKGVLTGELRKWHKITLGFDGPVTSETATTNPFTDYALVVNFEHAVSAKTYRVPGYFAADGNAANSGASSGNVWLVHFCPDKEGQWTYSASFFMGTNVAQNGGGSSAGFFDGATGDFSIAPTNKTGRDHRGKGRLQYVGQHHLQFAENSEWFLKAGADSPENFLAYEDFDNTPNYGGLRKSWAPHQIDYKVGDPTWAGGKGTEIIGAINYLSGKGMNAFSFLTMNIGGDDKNVFPYISDAAGDNRQRIDVSKTAQWEAVFEHADHMGLYLHFKTQETENDQLLDGGSLGLERKLYYRELVARFSHHLALNWNLGEENTNTDTQRKQFCDYFEQVDPYGHLVVVHTYLEEVYTNLLGYSTFDGASLLIDNKSEVFSQTLKWVQASSAAGRKWVVANDEQGDSSTGVVPDANDPAHDVVRKNVLWGNIMAGGAGVEYYFGYSYSNSDLTCADYRSRNTMWDQSRHALEFLQNNKVPFWEMSNRNDVVSVDWCLAKPGEVYVVYIKDGVTATIDLVVLGSYTVKWFNPITGGGLQDGSIKFLTGGNNDVSLGNAPNNVIHDWAILIMSGPPQPVPPPTPQPVVPPQPSPSLPGFSPIRINCGGPEYINSGVVWLADLYFNTKDTYATGSPIAGTAIDAIYQTERWDRPVAPELEYTIPVPIGKYSITLFFAEIYFVSAGKRVFNVEIEGMQVIASLDIYKEVGANTAFTYTVSPVQVSDQALNIKFIHVIENPKISAIQIDQVVPGPTPTPQPVPPPTPQPVPPPTAPNPIPPQPSPTPSGPRITGFVLIDANNDQEIGPLVNGNFINGVAKNIRADVAGSVQSVVFGFDTTGNFRTENVAPYAFAGNNGADYLSYTFALGQHTVTATPYVNGIVGTAMSVTFNVT